MDKRILNQHKNPWQGSDGRPSPLDPSIRSRFPGYFLMLALLIALPAIHFEPGVGAPKENLKVGVAAVPITPFGPNPDWDGTITESGVWGEEFTDTNGNRRWDPGEPFVDDPENTLLDPDSANKYDGIYLAGFGQDRLATGRHDDIWARALVLEARSTRIAVVALDLIGYFSRARYYGLAEIEKLLDKKLRLQEILVTSTHNHQGPDSIGRWGESPLRDGKFPKYLRFVDRQVARALALAAGSTAPARMKVGITNQKNSPTIAGMLARAGGRPPDFLDEELRVLEFVGSAGRQSGKTIASLVNWNAHPATMPGQSALLSSDFPHAVRAGLEEKIGGTSLYVSGDLGAVEIAGGRERTASNARNIPPAPDGGEPGPSFERTMAAGRDIAAAAADALQKGEWVPVEQIELRKGELRVGMDNKGIADLVSEGVLDVPILPREGEHPILRSWVCALTLGELQVVTAPGEAFPELFYGVEDHRRTDCPNADTGRSPEPSVHAHMTGKYKFIFGLCPDEFGYIVPGYDFYAPHFDYATGTVRLIEDPCKRNGVPDHYHESAAASSMLAAEWTSAAIAVLKGQ